MTGADLSLSDALTVDYAMLIVFWDRAGFLHLSDTGSGSCWVAVLALLFCFNEKKPHIVTEIKKWGGSEAV